MQRSTKTSPDLDLGLQFGELVLGRLEIHHGLAEHLALAHIIDRPVQRRLGRSHPCDRDLKPLPAQLLHEKDEALPLLAKPRLARQFDILEEQLRSILGVHAELLEIAAFRKSPKAAIHEEQRDAFRAERRVGLRNDNNEIGVLAVGDEGLRTVQHIAVAAPQRRRAHALEIGPSARLRHGDGADNLAPRHARQVAAALLLGAVGDDVGSDDVRMQAEARPRGSGARKLLHDDGRMQPVSTAAAIFVRDRRTKKPGLARRQPNGARHCVLLLPLRVMRRDLALDEAADLIAVKLVLLREKRSLQHD